MFYIYIRCFLDFEKINSFLCCFCWTEDETPLHLSYDCTKTKNSWNKLESYIANKTLSIPLLAPQRVISSFNELSVNPYLWVLFSLYNARSNDYRNSEYLKANINKTKNIEKVINLQEPKKRSKFLKNWYRFIDHNT